jgi:hypothetical protein
MHEHIPGMLFIMRVFDMAVLKLGTILTCTGEHYFLYISGFKTNLIKLYSIYYINTDKEG